MEAEPSTAFVAALEIVGVLSLAVLFYLFQKHIGGRSLLPYQPRRHVPWGPGVVVLAMSMPFLSVLAFLMSFLLGDPGAPEEISTENFVLMGCSDSAIKLFFLFGVMTWLTTFFRADSHDLGLPTSWNQFAKDVGIGTLACLAALLPINLVQFALVNAFESKTLHPLVKQLQEHHSPAILLISFTMAVIVAPLFEEFTFRGLLQGWLERCEDETISEKAISEKALPELENAIRPTQGWIPDLPHGWTPIFISAAAFGVAHIGHGVAPISLVLFGIVLGYLYQRTHRLVPSITAHMLFNAYSMVLLWLQLKTPPVG